MDDALREYSMHRVDSNMAHHCDRNHHDWVRLQLATGHDARRHNVGGELLFKVW